MRWVRRLSNLTICKYAAHCILNFSPILEEDPHVRSVQKNTAFNIGKVVSASGDRPPAKIDHPVPVQSETITTEGVRFTLDEGGDPSRRIASNKPVVLKGWIADGRLAMNLLMLPRVVRHFFFIDIIGSQPEPLGLRKAKVQPLPWVATFQ